MGPPNRAPVLDPAASAWWLGSRESGFVGVQAVRPLQGHEEPTEGKGDGMRLIEHHCRPVLGLPDPHDVASTEGRIAPVLKRHVAGPSDAA